MNKKDKAVELRQGKYNCCQAVLLTYAEETGVSAAELEALGSGFGMGMGDTKGICGALAGAVMIQGLLNHGKPTVQQARQIKAKFRERSGAVDCCDLKGIETGKLLCSCDDCVRNAISVLEEVN